jgi:TadE-like protein
MSSARRFLKDESGTSPIEFVLVFPIIFLIFTASFESSMFMLRAVMLERGVDETVRLIRLGLYDDIKHQELKERICKTGLMNSSVTNCVQSMKIWMQPIDTGNFAMVAPPFGCVDKAQEVNASEPAGSDFAYGTDNEIMLMRVCLKETPMFPTTGVSVKMPTFKDGTYGLIVTSVFVNEPGQ